MLIIKVNVLTIMTLGFFGSMDAGGGGDKLYHPNIFVNIFRYVCNRGSRFSYNSDDIIIK